MESSSLKAEVNASRDSRSFAADILHISVRSTAHARCEQGVWCLQPTLYECLVDDQLGRHVRQLTALPVFHLFSHRLEVPLHSVDTHRDAIDERERLRVFCEHRGKHACDNASELTLVPHQT